MVQCVKCGAKNPNDAEFCNNCGIRLDTTEAEEHILRSHKQKEPRFKRAKRFPYVKVAFTGVLAIILLLLTVYYVGVGEVGITYDNLSGEIDPIPKSGPQIYFKLPWQSVKHVFVATDSVDMWTEYDDQGVPVGSGRWPALDVPSEEGLVLHMDVTVRWHISPSSAYQIFTNFPALDYRDKIVFPAIRDVVRDTTGKHSALELYGPKRDVISADIKEKLSQRLKSDPVTRDAIVLEDFYMRKVWLPPDFRNSVEAKQVAEQNWKQSEFKRQQRLVEANATGQALIIEAEGRAEAVRALQERFTGMDQTQIESYLQYRYLEALNEGFVSGNKVIILLPTPTGENIILQLPKIDDDTK